MTAFFPQAVDTPYHFDIKRSREGCWIARDRGGLAGGTFLTCKDAVRFALFEVGGDSARVHVRPENSAGPQRPRCLTLVEQVSEIAAITVCGCDNVRLKACVGSRKSQARGANRGRCDR